MKKVILTIAVLLTFTACKKEEVTPSTCNSVETAFKNSLKGTYMQVGFKNDLFNEWSYTSSGPIITIDDLSISEPYNSNYEVLKNSKIFLESTNELMKVTFGDTMLWVNQSNDSIKFVKL